MKSQNKSYKCVHCGEAADALYKRYGPSVLKLTKCEHCKNFVDKYVEYDPVIIMIDLILMSRSAQRHVIYNTKFEPYWKIFIVLTILETYGVWRNDSLVNIVINTLCNIQETNSSNSTSIVTQVSNEWLYNCEIWRYQDKSDVTDLFIWEKNFYIQFTSVFISIAVFIITTYCLMKAIGYMMKRDSVSLQTLVKAFSLGNISMLFTIPMLIWGTTDTASETRLLHYLLVFAYSFVVFVNVYTVVYECPFTLTILVLIASHYTKFLTMFAMTPHIREFVS